MIKVFRRLAVLGLFLLAAHTPSAVPAAEKTIQPDDWAWWRGPEQKGIANGPLPPLEWSATSNVVWKTPIPGRGHSSPTVVGAHVYLTTADEAAGTQSVICLDRATGESLWETVVHRGGLVKKMNKKASHASSTIACDGSRLYVNFHNRGAVHTTALDRKGKILWQTKICDYLVHQGYGASPAIYKTLLLVSADNKSGGVVAALNPENGEFVWKVDRPSTPNYASPIVVHMHGRDQLVFIGCDKVLSLEPLSGKKIWEIDGSTTECVTSTVTNGDLVYTTGGYPKNHVSAVRGDGSGEVVWSNNVRVYVPSMVLTDNHLFAVADAGIAHCWDAATGELRWRGRLQGEFTATPVLVEGHLFAVNEKGHTSVFKADPKEFQLVASSQLGDQVLATPTICGGRIYLRVVEGSGDERQEMLYCIGRRERQ